MRRLVLQKLASAIALASPLTALSAEILHYDPAADRDADVPAPGTTVNITIDPSRASVLIPPRFYGVNVHPGSAKYEFARLDLLRALKPDSVRIMTLQRSDWPSTGTGRVVTPLSPARGMYDWAELDLLIRQIVEINAEPYLALGFGPPHWLSGTSSPRERRPPPRDKLAEYAEFMAMIVHRYATQQRLPLRRVTIDNEPENVGYAIDDYIELVRRAKEAIRARAPSVQVGGPTTGYAAWPQPDRTSLGFGASARRLKAAGTPFDFFDWHIYSTSPSTVLRTVNIVREIYGDALPLVISELNRDWRYSGAAKADSERHNTGWGSLAWLAFVYDSLQLMGVSQVFYFTWRENTLGLTDGRFTELRPNYYLFWALTNKLGRQRVHSGTDANAIGCIATVQGGRLSSLIYNRSGRDVQTAVNISSGASKFRTYAVDQLWVSGTKHALDKIGQVLPSPQEKSIKDLTVPAGGFVVIEQI